jgi:hypothetical protein
MHPSEYHRDLTEDRLVFLAGLILEQVYLTYETNDSDYDDAWVQGCAIFGRVKNLFIELGMASDPSWLTLAKIGMDITPMIGAIPFRFATDNPEAPRKERILEQSSQEIEQLGFAFEAEGDSLSSTGIYKWRWYIKKSYFPEDSPTVHFVGLNDADVPICIWSYDEGIPFIHSVGGKTPASKPSTEAPIHIPAAKVSIKKPIIK